MENENKFEYSYSALTAEERKYIHCVRGQYMSESSSAKSERLIMLDKRVRNAPKATAIAVGVAGVLIFGLGMSMFLEWEIKLWGVVIGVLGCLIAAGSYPIYRLARKKNKEKYAEEILRLSDELLGEKD